MEPRVGWKEPEPKYMLCKIAYACDERSEAQFIEASRQKRTGEARCCPVTLDFDDPVPKLGVKRPFPLLKQDAGIQFPTDRKWKPEYAVLVEGYPSVKLPLDGTPVQVASLGSRLYNNPAEIKPDFITERHCVVKVLARKPILGDVTELMVLGLVDGKYIHWDSTASYKITLRFGRLARHKTVTSNSLTTQRRGEMPVTYEAVGHRLIKRHPVKSHCLVGPLGPPCFEIAFEGTLWYMHSSEDPENNPGVCTLFYSSDEVQAGRFNACFDFGYAWTYTSALAQVAMRAETVACTVRKGARVKFNDNCTGIVVHQTDVTVLPDSLEAGELITMKERADVEYTLAQRLSEYCLKKWGGEHPVVASFQARCNRTMLTMRESPAVERESIVKSDSCILARSDVAYELFRWRKNPTKPALVSEYN